MRNSSMPEMIVKELTDLPFCEQTKKGGSAH